MKTLCLFVLIILTTNIANAEPTCTVQICNRIERFSLSIWSHVKDHMGESCYNMQIPKSEAVPVRVLDSGSRWYQGSHINPTKKSVTRIKKVIECH